MFGSKKFGAQLYQTVGLETGVVDASPLKLIVMLYDGAITACIKAKQAIQQDDILLKGEYITHATSIIESGLRKSLNKTKGGQIALSLDELYQYMIHSLVLANLRKDMHKVQEIIDLLSELKGAWESLEKQVQPVPNENNALGQLIQQKTSQVQFNQDFHRLSVAGA